MDYRCPACEKDMGSRRLSQMVIARLETECIHCKSRLRFNVHRAEFTVVMFNFAALAVFVSSAYWLRSRELALIAFGCAMLGALVLPVLERTSLRAWPRFVRAPDRAIEHPDR